MAVCRVGVIALLTVAAVWRWVPLHAVTGEESVRGELRALHRPQVWLALGIGTVGFGGMFATYAYISPTMTELTGLEPATIPLVLALYGIGMTAGAFLSGRVARIGLLRGIIVNLGAIAVMLALFGFAASQPVLALISVFFLGLLPSILVPMLQTRMMDVAHEGQSLAAALNHSTLNIAKRPRCVARQRGALRGARLRVALAGRCGPGRPRRAHRPGLGAPGALLAYGPGARSAVIARARFLRAARHRHTCGHGRMGRSVPDVP